MAQVRRRRGVRLARRFGAHAGAAAALGLVVVVAIALLLGLAARGMGSGTVLERGDPTPVGDFEPGIEAEGQSDGESVNDSATILVHVDGAVRSPGVYELEEGMRVHDAVLAAGGLAESADTSGMNLAARVGDGEKVHVPLAGENAVMSGGGTSASGPSLVNINTATAEELDELPGVGESTARAIIEDREKNGAFGTPEDLMRVSGIGEKKFERLEAMICV